MDDDFEKPMLSCQPCSEKLPIILSNDDVQPPIQVPSSIAQYLRDYQIGGVRFLYHRFNAGEGGILGDDMGLGKTIQGIAFIAAVLQMKGTKEDKLRHCMEYIREDIAPGIDVPSVDPVLLICPASLTDNWQDELRIWGHFTVQRLTAANRLDLIHRAKRKECDVVIITFELARSSIDFLNQVDWTCVLVDEVHRIKDNGSQVTKALCSLRCKIRFGFTGTPFQNNMREVLCLLNWSNPQSMGNANTFANDISRAVELGNRSSATKREKAEHKLACLRFKQLKRKFILRRTKDILAKHLPPKTDQVVFCELTQIQKDIYRMITNSPDLQELLSCSKDDHGCSKDAQASVSKKRTGLLFTYLHLLQKTANHVGLLVSGVSSPTNEVSQAVCRQALEDCAGLAHTPEKKWMDALSDVNMSGKMLVLSQLLPVFLERKDKILIFSYSTRVLDFVQKYLHKMRFKFCRLDGSTPAKLRFPMVQSFNSSPDVPIFLLSTKAGGVGLNITGANVVILYDPNWNPAHDMQAQDRAYRLGQQREVRVYRLLSTSTIEEFVYLRQVYKQQLGSCSMTSKNVRRYFDGVSGDTRYYGELFGIKNLFSFRESEGSLTEEILLKQQQFEDKVRLKLEAPVKEKGTDAFLAPCGVVKKYSKCSENEKSGLVQLCQDVFETHDTIGEEDDNDINDEDEDEDEDKDDDDNYDNEAKEEENDKSNSSINTLLEKSGAVRHVIQHQEVVATSKVEAFVTDCAIRDVFQKGENSQLPAFDCSIETQNEPVQQKCEQDNVSAVARFKFIQIARNEFLTPLELATKIMSMTKNEKLNLLNKYNKRKQVASEAKSVQKRVRIPESVEVTLSKKKVVEVPCSTQTKCLQSESHDEACLEKNQLGFEALSPEKRCDDDDIDSSECEKPSSFEKEAKAVCPSLSSEAIRLVEKVICRKKKKEACNRSAPVSQEDTGEGTRTSKSSKEYNEKLVNSSENKASIFCDSNLFKSIDHETGCSTEAVALVGSMFFSSGRRKPSPQKNINKSLPVNFEASTSRCVNSNLTFCEKPISSRVNDSLKANFTKYEPEEPLFKAEDDVYLRLIKSGKLKQI